MKNDINYVASILGVAAVAASVIAWFYDRFERHREYNTSQTREYIEMLNLDGSVEIAKNQMIKYKDSYSKENHPSFSSLEHQGLVNSIKEVAVYYSTLWKCFNNGPCVWNVVSSECSSAVLLFQTAQEVELWYGNSKKNEKTSWELMVEHCNRRSE